MIIISALLVCVGLAVVIITADVAINRISNLSRHFRISEFTTSFIIAGIVSILPEFTIGIVSALEGTSTLGFGVVLSSNVIDITLVIGVAVLYAGRIKLNNITIKNIQTSFASVTLPVILFIDGEISSVDGLILLVGYVSYVILLLRTKRDGKVTGNKRNSVIFVETAILLASLAFLLVGAGVATEGAQELSSLLALPLFLIGLVVAIGTCMPELIFSIRSSKKHGEIGLGNILGNVLSDCLLTIGVISLIQPIRPIKQIFPMVTGLFMAFSALILVVISRKGELNRKDAMLLLVLFFLFILSESAIEAFHLFSS